MRTYIIDGILDLGDDVLRVDGHWMRPAVGEPVPVLVQAFGWVSATANHYDPDQYDQETGHLVDGATAHQMSTAELLAYAQRLLAEQDPNPEPTVLYAAGK